MTEDTKKDEILSEKAKDKDKEDLQDTGGAPDSGSQTTQDADSDGPSAGTDGSLNKKESPAPEVETAGTEALTQAPADKSEEVVEKPSASSGADPAKEEEAAGSETFSKPVTEKKAAKGTKGKDSETVSDGFKPHYQAEKKPNVGVQALLWILLAVFGVTIIGATIEALFINPSDFRLPASIVTIIWLLVTIPLWKKISLEAKVGLEALALGFLMAVAYTVYQGELVFPGVPAAILVPSLFCLMLLVTLICVWLIWPRIFWLPIVLSVIVLLGLVAPVWSLVNGGKDLMGILVMPSISFWPHLAGWIMAQIIFPFGIILLLVLQFKNLFGKKVRKHAGFVLWALGLALIWTAPLAALDRSGETVFPKFGQFASQTFGVTQPAAPPADVAVVDTTDAEAKPAETPAADKPAPEVKPEPAPADTVAETPAPADTAAETPAPADDQAATATDEAVPAAADDQPVDETLVKAEPAPAAAVVTSEELNQLRERVTNLETEVAGLQDKISKQDRLIQDLFIWLADKFTQDIKARTQQSLGDMAPEMDLTDTGTDETVSPADDSSTGPKPAAETGDPAGPSTTAPSTDPKDDGSSQPGPDAPASGTPEDTIPAKEAT